MTLKGNTVKSWVVVAVKRDSELVTSRADIALSVWGEGVGV